MNDKDKIKLFEKDFKKLTKDWSKNTKNNFYNEYLNVWLFGFNACEKEFDKKLQKYLDKKGI